MVNMLPGIAGKNVLDGCGENAILSRKVGVSVHQHVCTDTYISNGLLGELRKPVDFAKCHLVSGKDLIGIALNHIPRVISMIPGIQVIGIDTPPVIAGMKREHPIGEWTMNNLIRHAVSKHLAVSAISRIGDIAKPQPARFLVGLQNMRPKSTDGGIVVLHMNLLTTSCAAPPVTAMTRGLSRILSCLQMTVAVS